MATWWKTLRADFKRLRMTNAFIASEMGVSEGAVSHWLRGFREPSVDVISRLCALAGRSVAEVMSDDPYWITNPSERALLDAWRTLPDSQRSAFLTIIGQGRKEPQA